MSSDREVNEAILKLEGDMVAVSLGQVETDLERVVARATLLLSYRLGQLAIELARTRAVSEQLFDTLHPPG